MPTYANALNVQPTVNTAVIGTGSAFSTLAYTSAATASTLMSRDSNINSLINNLITGYATTVTAAGTTTLTVASARQQYFTGSTTQTVLLPVVSTLPQTGFEFEIYNNSTGAVTVQSSGANTVQVMAAGSYLKVTAISLTGTTAASWSNLYVILSDVANAITTINGDSGSVTGSTVTFTGTGSGLTFSGSSSTMTLGGTLNLSHGGTNASLTASNGGIFYSTASAGAILAGTATANQMLMSGASSAPSWSAAVYPNSTTINQILYSSANNNITGLAAGNNGVLISSNSGVPSWLANGTPGQVLTAQSGAPPAWATASAAGFVWTSVSSAPTTAANTGYMATAALTVTLPNNPVDGYIVGLLNASSGTVLFQAQGSDVIQQGSAVGAAAGTATSTTKGDCLVLTYQNSGKIWFATPAGQGIWSIA